MIYIYRKRGCTVIGRGGVTVKNGNRRYSAVKQGTIIDCNNGTTRDDTAPEVTVVITVRRGTTQRQRLRGVV